MRYHGLELGNHVRVIEPVGYLDMIAYESSRVPEYSVCKIATFGNSLPGKELSQPAYRHLNIPEH